jgi:hypothetical protein
MFCLHLGRCSGHALMTLRCLWVASNENAERVLGGLENNTKSALAVKLLIVASGNIAVFVGYFCIP